MQAGLADAEVLRDLSQVQAGLPVTGDLGTARQRLAALASLTAVTDGQVSDAAAEGPFGFCQFASAPGQVVSLDTFYVGGLKRVGAVWQPTAVNVATRIAVVELVVGETAAVARRS